jgi:hypothetical protein
LRKSTIAISGWRSIRRAPISRRRRRRDDQACRTHRPAVGHRRCPGDDRRRPGDPDLRRAGRQAPGSTFGFRANRRAIVAIARITPMTAKVSLNPMIRAWRLTILPMATLTEIDNESPREGSYSSSLDHDVPGATTEWRVVGRAGHTAKASTRTRAPSCSDPCRSIRRGSSAGTDWRSCCCPAAAVRPSACR